MALNSRTSKRLRFFSDYNNFQHEPTDHESDETTAPVLHHCKNEGTSASNPDNQQRGNNEGFAVASGQPHVGKLHQDLLDLRGHLQKLVNELQKIMLRSQEQKKDLEKQLEVSENKRKELDTVILDYEGQIKDLKNDVKNLLEVGENKRKELGKVVLGYDMDLKNDLKQSEAKTKDLNKSVHQCEDYNKEERDQVGFYESKIENLTIERDGLINKLNTIRAELKEAQEDLGLGKKVWEVERIALAERLANAKELWEAEKIAVVNETLTKEHQDSTCKYTELGKQLEKSEARNKDLEKELDKSEAEKKELNNIVSEQHTALSSYENHIKDLKKELDQVGSQESKIETLTKERDDWIDKYNQALKQRDSALEKLNTIGAKLKGVRNDFELSKTDWNAERIALAEKIDLTTTILTKERQDASWIYNKALTERDTALNEQKHLEVKLKEVQEDLTKSRAELESRTKELDTAMNNLNFFGAELNEVRENLSKAWAKYKLGNRMWEAEKMELTEKLDKFGNEIKKNGGKLLDLAKINEKHIEEHENAYCAGYLNGWFREPHEYISLRSHEAKEVSHPAQKPVEATASLTQSRDLVRRFGI